MVSGIFLEKSRINGSIYTGEVANAADCQTDRFTHVPGHSTLSYVYSITPLKIWRSSVKSIMTEYHSQERKPTILYPQRGIAFYAFVFWPVHAAIELSDETLRLAERVGDPLGTMQRFCQWRAQRVAGDLAGALASASGFTIWLNRRKISHTGCSGTAALGAACTCVGSWPTPPSAWGRPLPSGERYGYMETGQYCLGVLSLCAMRQGDRERAADAAERGLLMDVPMFAHDGSYEGFGLRRDILAVMA